MWCGQSHFGLNYNVGSTHINVIVPPSIIYWSIMIPLGIPASYARLRGHARKVVAAAWQTVSGLACCAGRSRRRVGMVGVEPTEAYSSSSNMSWSSTSTQSTYVMSTPSTDPDSGSETEAAPTIRVIVTRRARPTPGPTYLEIEMESDEDIESEGRLGI